MKKRPRSPKRPPPFPGSDAVRIVPLRHGPAVRAPALAAAPGAQMTYRGGPLLTNVQVYTIFWGAAWSTTLAAFARKINAFFGVILTSPLLDQMAEYSTPAHTIGHGSLLGTRTVASPAPRTTVGDSDIQTFLQQQISRRSIPRPTPNTLYFVYLPRGTAVTMGGGRSCQAFCGYHDHIGGTVFYAVLPYPGCAGCAGGLKAFDAATSTSSHELCEAITDPVPGSGWYDDNAGEIGDVCAWSTRKIGKYTIQKEWSNQSGGCQ